MEPKKVELKCKWCGRYYEWIYNVPSNHCSTKCAETADYWQRKDQLKASKNAKKQSESVAKSEAKTLNIKQKGEQEPSPIEQKKPNMSASDTTKTVNNLTKNESKGPEKTVSTPTENNEKIMQKTESHDSKTLVTTELKETQAVASKLPFIDTDVEKFHMTSLLDSSANALHDQMKGMFALQPHPSEGIRTYEPEKVQTSVMCAREIVNILRLKLDIVKVYRDSK